MAGIPEPILQFPLPFPWELSLTMTSATTLEQDIPITLSKTHVHSLPSPQREVSEYWPHRGLQLPTEHHRHIPSFLHVTSHPLSITSSGELGRDNAGLRACHPVSQRERRAKSCENWKVWIHVRIEGLNSTGLFLYCFVSWTEYNLWIIYTGRYRNGRVYPIQQQLEPRKQ